MRSSRSASLALDDEWVLGHRGPRVAVDPTRPYAYHVEPERTRDGTIEDVATIFITNRECPFRCLMCDLWMHTTSERVANGAVAEQIRWALERMPPAQHLKLYNAGNFFDRQAIPPADWSEITALARDFRTVIVESHPRLISRACEQLAEMLEPRLEVAMGLETVDPDVLPRLNKRMTLTDFVDATRFLSEIDVDVRAFILVRTPFQSGADGVEWAKRSLDFAFSIGVGCCTVIPTRVGNGAMDWLQAQGDFEPPSLRNLEEVLAYGLQLGEGRVFADLWNIERLFTCPRCGPARAARLDQMNLRQEVAPEIACGCET